MASFLARGRLVPVACLAVAVALATSCASGSNKAASAASGMGGTGGSAGTGGSLGTGGSTTGTAGPGTGGSGGPTALSLPQLVHGAAYADALAFPTLPLVVGVSGAEPDSVDVILDSAAPVSATAGADGWVAPLPINLVDPGSHTLLAQAKSGGTVTATVKGSLTIAEGSMEFTTFATAGVAYDSHVWHDVPGDALVYTWVSDPPGKQHQLYLNRLDGAFNRLLPADLVINDPADEPLTGYTAAGPSGIGVVYMTEKPGDAHWLVKMRVVDETGKQLVPVMDLTQGQAAYSMQQAGADPGGFSAAWLHITPAADPSNPPPVEVRFSRWDVAAKKLVGPITLDSDQPQAAGSTQGAQTLEPLAEISIACNTAICLVAYTRDVYNTLVELNIPKIFVATVDLASGALAGTPVAVEASDWDTQEWGQHLVAVADGSFVLVYTANDTVAAVTPKSPCDESLERDLLFAVKIDATGKKIGTPKPIFDDEGSREYPRIAPHPAGFALFWEDQRSECSANGHIRMAPNVASPDLSMLLDPYLEMPGSIALPPEDPTLAVTGTNLVAGWSDNRHGNGLTDIETEIYLDTYWRK